MCSVASIENDKDVQKRSNLVSNSYHGSTQMKRWIFRIILGLAVLAVVLVAFAWSVLAIPYFSDFRSKLVSELLTEQIGQPLLVNGDVSVVVSPVSRVRASGVQIPSENMPDVDLATLVSFEFDIDLFALLDGRVDLNNLFVDGLQIMLLRREDGTKSWSEREQATIGAQSIETPDTQNSNPTPTDAEKDSGPGLLAFLKTRSVTFTNIRLITDDVVSGFEYDFELEKFSLNQLEDGLTLGVTSIGKVNGYDFTLEGNYPEAEPFTTAATFSSAELTFNGVPFSEEDGGGFEGDLNLTITALGDLLDVLKLEGGIDGAATVRSKITSRSGITSLANFSAVFELEEGQLISLKGDLADFTNAQGFDLEFDARLHPENAPPAAAKDLADFKLTHLSTRIISQNQSLELDDLVLSTNAFEQGLDKVGPVSVGRIRRTEEGTLAFQDISLQAGPLDAPILVAHGNIFNILELKDLDIEGDIDAPASLVLSGLGDDVAAAFGGIHAEFALDDAQDALSITRLKVQTVDTDVWALNADIAVADMSSLSEASAELELDIKNGAEFLTALNLKPVNTGPLAFGLSVLGNEGAWAGEIKLGAGTSELTSTVTSHKENDRNTINSAMISESMVIEDLKNAVAGVIELSKIGQQQPSKAEAASDIKLQPLVLSSGSQQEVETTAPETSSDVELQPLVIAVETDEIFSLNEFLRETDIYGEINFKEISGINGVTKISSEFVSEGGKARLGPLEFNYGGGYFNFQAAVDVIEAPRFVSVSGVTSGWNLADIMKTAGVSFDANGNLGGEFKVAGNLTTVKSFINSMRGNAVIRMSNGQVATSLLELAGLGIFPWLFSEERRRGYTDVTCVNVPININSGVVSFDAVVAETGSVQLVAKGAVDWASDSITIRAEPRPLGRPLARSAWPFDVSGKLSDPRFKLDVGGSRHRRADGADKMPANRQPCRPDIFQLH